MGPYIVSQYVLIPTEIPFLSILKVSAQWNLSLMIKLKGMAFALKLHRQWNWSEKKTAFGPEMASGRTDLAARDLYRQDVEGWKSSQYGPRANTT